MHSYWTLWQLGFGLDWKKPSKCSDGGAVVDYCCQLTLPFLSSRRHQTFEGRWFILHMHSLFISVYQKMLVSVCKNRLWELSPWISITAVVKVCSIDSVTCLMEHVCSSSLLVLLLKNSIYSAFKMSVIVHTQYNWDVMFSYWKWDKILVCIQIRLYLPFKKTPNPQKTTACKLKKSFATHWLNSRLQPNVECLNFQLSNFHEKVVS